jgi:hypothetical protein
MNKAKAKAKALSKNSFPAVSLRYPTFEIDSKLIFSMFCYVNGLTLQNLGLHTFPKYKSL